MYKTPYSTKLGSNVPCFGGNISYCCARVFFSSSRFRIQKCKERTPITHVLIDVTPNITVLLIHSFLLCTTSTFIKVVKTPAKALKNPGLSECKQQLRMNRSQAETNKNNRLNSHIELSECRFQQRQTPIHPTTQQVLAPAMTPLRTPTWITRVSAAVLLSTILEPSNEVNAVGRRTNPASIIQMKTAAKSFSTMLHL
jgi:hypothetical protein